MVKNEKGGRVKTVKRIIYIILIINVITILVPCRASVDIHRPGFISIIGDELRQVAENSNFQNAELTEEYKNLVFFSPPILDFEQRSIGMPLIRQVHVHNLDARHSLHLLSISGSSSNFHCSFFEDKLVTPLGNTSFDICFLPKQLGAVDTTLYIHSSRGSFKFKVHGTGIANPYRIRPYIGARVPINSSFTSLISIHNPHMDILQVEEVFSSAGDLHLELPSKDNNAAKEFWSINPFETKSIIRANFLGRVVNNHSAYIRIRTNRDNRNEMIVVPVEVEVTSTPGIFSTTEVLDFGMMRSFDPPSLLPLNLIYSGDQTLQITSVFPDPPNDAVHIDFFPVELSTDIHCPTLVAHVIFDASKAMSSNQWQGRVAVKLKESQHIFYTPYYAQVWLGSLKYNHSQTIFFSNGSVTKDITEELVVRNLFQEQISIYNFSIPQNFAHLFTIANFTCPIILQSNETVSLFNITFHPPLEALLLTIKLILHTNLSTFHIPLRIYHGLLRLSQHSPAANKNHLDFGTMAFGQKKALNITVYNENPVSIVILKFLANMEKTAIKLVHMEENNKTLLYQFIPEKYKDALVLLKPNNSAMFSIEVTAPDIESTYTAGVIVETQFQHLYIPMHMKVTSGTISFYNDSIVLPFCFPGKISSLELKVTSTFGNAVRIRDILFYPNDTRFYYVPLKIKQSISSNKLTSVGHLFFDMRRDCRDDCYASLPTHTHAGIEWLHNFALDKDVAISDIHLAMQYQTVWKRFTRSSTKKKKVPTATLR